MEICRPDTTLYSDCSTILTGTRPIRHFRLFALLPALVLVAACSAGHDVIHTTTTSAPPAQRPAPAPPPPVGTVSDREGVIAGAQVSGRIGILLSEEDRERLHTTTQNALETGVSGVPVKWRNNQTGSHGSVTPQPAFRMDGADCREFQQHVNAGGEMATGYGTACRDRRGIWRIAESG